MLFFANTYLYSKSTLWCPCATNQENPKEVLRYDTS